METQSAAQGSHMTPEPRRWPCVPTRHEIDLVTIRLAGARGAGRGDGNPNETDKNAAKQQCTENHKTHTSSRTPQEKCAAEREKIGVHALAAAYGTNRNKRNAFGKWVAREAHAGH